MILDKNCCSPGVYSVLQIMVIMVTSFRFISDIDECTTKPCANNAQCVNHIGSYGCHCPIGFTGTPVNAPGCKTKRENHKANIFLYTNIYSTFHICWTFSEHTFHFIILLFCNCFSFRSVYSWWFSGHFSLWFATFEYFIYNQFTFSSVKRGNNDWWWFLNVHVRKRFGSINLILWFRLLHREWNFRINNKWSADWNYCGFPYR